MILQSTKNHYCQRAKKVASDSPGLVDFAIGLVNSVFNLPDGQVIFFRNSNNRRTVINPAHQIFFRLVEMTFGLVHASYSLPQWQAVKLTFFVLPDCQGLIRNVSFKKFHLNSDPSRLSCSSLHH